MKHTLKVLTSKTIFKISSLSLLTFFIISTLALAQLQYHPISEIRWGTQANGIKVGI